MPPKSRKKSKRPLRLTDEQYRLAKKAAQGENISLNSFFVRAIVAATQKSLQMSIPLTPAVETQK